MKKIVLLICVLFNILNADTKYECVVMSIEKNSQIIYDRMNKIGQEPFAKTTISKRKNVLFDGTFYYHFMKTKNNADFYVNNVMKTLVFMSSTHVKIVDNKKIYTLGISDTNSQTSMQFMCLIKK